MDVDDDKVIDALGSALRYGGAALADVPDLLKRLLQSGAWRDFTTQRREHVTHERFADFVTASPLAGLGSTVDLLRRILTGDPMALDLLDRELQNPVGRPETNDNVQDKAPAGNRADAALRRLRKDRPDLHAEVLAGNLTAHAAAVAAGFRPRTITVRADSPEAIAATLRRQLGPDQLAELARLLTEG